MDNVGYLTKFVRTCGTFGQSHKGLLKDDGGLEWTASKVGRFHRVCEICRLIGRSKVGKEEERAGVKCNILTANSIGYHDSVMAEDTMDIVLWYCFCVRHRVSQPGQNHCWALFPVIQLHPNETNKSEACRRASPLPISPEQDYVLFFNLTDPGRTFHSKKPSPFGVCWVMFPTFFSLMYWKL